MANSFEQAAALIRAGKNIDLSSIDVNAIYSDSEFDFHESSNFENEYKKTTSKTLLHVAIESENVQVFNALLDAGANPNINVEIRDDRKQRVLQSGSAFFGPAEWSDWEDWEPTHTTTTTRDLAQKFGNQEIIGRLDSILSQGLRK